jgi:hypothetical protein
MHRPLPTAFKNHHHKVIFLFTGSRNLVINHIKSRCYELATTESGLPQPQAE